MTVAEKIETTDKQTPSIIHWLSDKAGPLSAADETGFQMTMFQSRWRDIRGLHAQLKTLANKGVGFYKHSNRGGNSPDASYRFKGADGVLHIIELFPTERISYTGSRWDD